MICVLQAHCHFFVVQNFGNFLNIVDTTQPVKDVLTQLCQLYAVYGIVENSGEFIQVGNRVGSMSQALAIYQALQCLKLSIF